MMIYDVFMMVMNDLIWFHWVGWARSGKRCERVVRGVRVMRGVHRRVTT